MSVSLKNTRIADALRRAGFKHNEALDARVSHRKVTIVPRDLDDEYTPAQRRAIDHGIAQSEKEFAAGLGRGPFHTAEEFTAAMEADIKKLRIAKRKAKPAR